MVPAFKQIFTLSIRGTGTNYLHSFLESGTSDCLSELSD